MFGSFRFGCQAFDGSVVHLSEDSETKLFLAALEKIYMFGIHPKTVIFDSPEIADPAKNPLPPLHIHALCVKPLSTDCISGGRSNTANAASAPIRAVPRFRCNAPEYYAGEMGCTLPPPSHHQANLPATTPPPGCQAASLATSVAEDGKALPSTAAARDGELNN